MFFKYFILFDIIGFNLFSLSSLIELGFAESGFILTIIVDVIVLLCFWYGKRVNKIKLQQEKDRMAEMNQRLNKYTDEFGLIEWEDI